MNPLDELDTIAAGAAPPGPAVRGLVRLSGPRAPEIARFGFRDESGRPEPTRAEARSGSLVVAGIRRPIRATVVAWPGTRSYTGRPMAEIHVSGAPPIVSAVLAHCLRSGARLAEPGEFTLRAFLSGRIDLTQSEAVLGVIDAGTPARLEAALAQLAGGLSGPIGETRDFLLDTLAHLEANLDFAEEPDVDVLGRSALAQTLDRAADRMRALAGRLDARDHWSRRPRVVLTGLPNAGKSRLFNAMVRTARAIVSDVAGTTRDYLSAVCDCDGLSVELVDTAGETAIHRNPAEFEAERHRRLQVERADLRLLCLPPGADPPVTLDDAVPTLVVRTKADLVPSPAGQGVSTSAATGEGLSELRSAIARSLRGRSSESDAPAGTGPRCRESLASAAAALASASETVLMSGGDELVAVDLRQALDDLGRVVGAVTTDDVLDRIFGRFCIGK